MPVLDDLQHPLFANDLGPLVGRLVGHAHNVGRESLLQPGQQ